jgi:hypothetical protein
MIQFATGRAYKLPAPLEDAATTVTASSSIPATSSAISSSTKAPVTLLPALPNTNQHLTDDNPHPSDANQHQTRPKDPELAPLPGAPGSYQVISDLEATSYILLSLLAMAWLAFYLYGRRRRNRIRKEATAQYEKSRYSPMHERSLLGKAAFDDSLRVQQKEKRVLSEPIDLRHVV